MNMEHEAGRSVTQPDLEPADLGPDSIRKRFVGGCKRLAIVAVAAASALPLAACEQREHDDSRPASVVDKLRAMDPMTATLYGQDTVRAELEDPATAFEEAAYANSIVSDQGIRIDPGVRDNLRRMVQARQGQVYLHRQPGDQQSSSVLQALPSEQRVWVQQAGQHDQLAEAVRSEAYGDGYPEARQILAAANVAPQVKREIGQYVDAKQAEDELSGLTQPDDFASANQIVESLQDPMVRRVADKYFQAEVGVQVIGELEAEELSRNKARQIARRWVTDSKVKLLMDKVLRAWRGIDEYGLPAYSSEAPKEALSDLSDDAHHDLSGLATAPQYAKKASNALDWQYRRGELGVDKRINELMRATNDEVEPVDNLPETNIDPHAVVDLTGVKGKEGIYDAGALRIAGSLDGSYVKKPLLLHEFGNVTVKDGRAILIFEQDKRLQPEAKRLIQMAMKRVEPLLVSAARSGSLNGVRLVIGEEGFGPYYDPRIREQVMVLPSDDTTSFEQLTAAWTHETIHSLLRETFHGTELHSGEAKLIAGVCAGMKQQVYEDLQSSLKTASLQLGALRTKLRPEHQPIIGDLEEDIKNGVFVQKMSFTLLGPEAGNEVSNDCLGATTGVLREVVARYGQLKDVSGAKLNYILELPEMGDLAMTIDRMFDNATIYAKLNEANYVRTQWSDKDQLGHSEDNANELLASTFDALLTFGPQFTEVLRQMEKDDRALTLEVINMGGTLLMNRHPELRPLIQNHISRLERDLR